MIKWNIKRGRVQRTTHGTTRAHLYYWVRHEGAYAFTCGFYGYGQEITHTKNGAPLVFSTIGQARAYCEAKDREAVIIEAVTA